MTDRLLTARELAAFLGLKPGTILDKWERGELPGYRFGRAVRFDLAEVLATGRPDGGGEAPSHSTPPGRSSIRVAKPLVSRGEEDA